MKFMKPGGIAKLLGTLTAVAGLAMSLYNWDTPDDRWFLLGGLLVIGGLLIRIEGAVASAARRGAGLND